MSETKDTGRIVDPDENDHDEHIGSTSDDAARGLSTANYTTPSRQVNPDDKMPHKADTTNAVSSSTTIQEPSRAQSDTNGVGNAAPETKMTTKDTTTTAPRDAQEKKPAMEQETPKEPSAVDDKSSERDTIDNPPAKPLSDRVDASQKTQSNDNSDPRRSQNVACEPAKEESKESKESTCIDLDQSFAAKEHVSNDEGKKPLPARLVVVKPQDTKPPATATQAFTSNKEGPSATTPIGTTDEADVHDPFDAVQVEIRKERMPLTDLYEPYIAPCDTSLNDARCRLITALQQTRRLQKAFTDRVYEKYRVCLRPPPPLETTLERIRIDPGAALKRLQDEQEQIRLEKEMEKKEASFLNAELRRQPSAPADQADQLMFMTAGLNLVMLPDDTSIDPEYWKPYTDGRGPTNEFGQRTKSISTAAATAGELIVDRTRKAAALRVERQRRRQLQLLSGDSSRSSRPPTIAPAGISSILQGTAIPGHAAPVAGAQGLAKKADSSKAPPSLKQPPSAAGGSKTGKSRSASSTLTANSLLSLHYSADQVDIANSVPSRAAAPATGHRLPNQSRFAASTSALMAKGVGAATPKIMSTQFRLRHPHPESLGGQRRANTWTGSTAPTADNVAAVPRQQQPFPEAFLKQTLPPLPTVRDRLERKPLIVSPSPDSATERAQNAVKKVLQPFVKPSFSEEGQKLGDVTKIRVLHNLWRLGNEVFLFDDSESGADTSPKPVGLSDEPDPSSPLDPVVAFMVLHSVGLIGRSQRAKGSSGFETRFPVLGDDTGSEKLRSVREKILGNTHSSFTDGLFAKKRKRGESETEDRPPKKQKQTEVSHEDPSLKERAGAVDHTGLPIMSIRGGGESTKKAKNSSKKNDESRSRAGSDEQDSEPAAQSVKKGDDTATSPERSFGRQQSAAAQASATEPSPQHVAVSGGSLNPSLPGYLTPPERFHHSSAINSLHLAQQLRQGTFQHPAGDIAAANLPYLQHHEGFDLASFVGAGGLRNAHSSLTALNYARQNQAVAEARAQLYAREQQTAALLRSAAFSQQGHAYGTGSGTHAFAALLGNPGHSALLNNGQYPIALGGHVGGMSQTMYQPALLHLDATQAHSQAQTQAQAPSVPTQTQSEPPAANTAAKAQRESTPDSSPSRPKMKPSDSPPRSRSASADATDKPKKAPNKESANVAISLQNKEEAPAKEDKGDEKTLGKLPPTSNVPANETGQEETNKGSSTTEIDQEKAALTKNATLAIEQSQTIAQDARKHPASSNPITSAQPVTEKPEETLQVDQGNYKVASTKTDDGMRFIVPAPPTSMSRQDSDNIRDGRFYEVAVRQTKQKDLQSALKYLVECGGAIPIPRSLVLNPLRERLNTPGFKANSTNGLPSIPRDVVAYTILVWLWANHEIAFRDAFEKSGRIDVDPDCKWLIHAAVDTAIRELTSEIAQERAVNKGPFASSTGTSDEKSEASTRLEIRTAKIVSKSLMTELRVLDESNLSTPNFQHLVEYLDEARMCALRAKSQERALLASLLSRRTNISESFSHAYTSAIVRAGEAYGHENLLEYVQDESVSVSSMLPYDICSDDIGEWEDPCRPNTGFATNVSAIELKRRAYARAMIQKSLKKLQDRHNTKGGVLGQGPLSEQPSDESSGSSRNATVPTPRAGYKRKWASFSEPPPPPGTGSAPAPSWASYDPLHFSAPLEWDTVALENTPYGRYDSHERPRSLSISLSARADNRSGKKARRAMSLSIQSVASSVSEKHGLNPSTREIPWVEVAGIFQRLELPKKSSPKASQHDHHASVPVPAGSVIVAPFCRQVVRELSDTEESDTEEDLSDEHVVSQHEAVLEKMKHKLSIYMEAKQRQNERKRGRPSRGS